jgi:CheY-like chemotaxis protein
MNAIQGITEMKMRNDTLAPDIAEAFYRIHSSGNMLLNIINDVLDISKIEAGKFELTPLKYDTAGFINDTVHLNIMRFKNKPIKFKLLVDSNIPSALFGDPIRIRQILNNLLSNAFKYTAEGVVELSVHIESGSAGTENENSEVTLVLRVSDTGQGMTAEQIRTLFDEYSRFNPQANREIEGTGLGMNITQLLIQMMNGKISVESEPGKGSMFTVKLPQGTTGSEVIGRELAEDLQQLIWSDVSGVKKAKIDYKPMSYGRILIVDDMESNLYVFKGLTEPYKLSVDTATSGFEAVDKIRNGNVYDIILMDHMMPKMDGIETTKKIRDMNYTRPIVALTANAQDGQAEIFLANGFNDYLSKPIDIQSLDILLNRLIRDKQPPEVIEMARTTAEAAGAAGAHQEAGVNKITSMVLKNPRLVKVLIRDIEKAVLTLDEIHNKKLYDEDDVIKYVTAVHGMKSAVGNIGENELSSFAQKLEDAGKKNDKSEMLSETSLFIDGLRELIKKITPKE